MTTDCSVVTSYGSMTVRLPKRLREVLSLDLVDDFLWCDTNYGQRLDGKVCLCSGGSRVAYNCWVRGKVVEIILE